MNKIGRNEKCPCGSGKKFKKCHMNKKDEGVPEEVLRYFARKNAEKDMLERAGIRIPLVPPIIFKGSCVRAFGHKIYANRPVNETFHMFLIGLLHETLGSTWWLEQENLSPTERHFVAVCYGKFGDWVKRNESSAPRLGETDIWSAKPDGYTKSLIQLAFDVVSLTHMQELPTELLQRLRSRNEYQGARYEIAIAAIFARLGFTVVFTDPKTSAKRCEFTATDPKTGASFAVEVKSRRRKGVLHEDGEVLDPKELQSGGKIWRLFKDALEQNPKNIPFVVFIDINSPITPTVSFEEKPWAKDARKFAVEKLQQLPPTDYPVAVFFTNFSYHYETENEAQPGEVVGILQTNPTFPLVDSALLNAVYSALQHNGFVPPVELEKNSSGDITPSIYD